MKKKYRNEWKYCCTNAELARIEAKLSALLEKDQHTDNQGRYHIHSLYFDDLRNTCAWATEAGEAERFKYRIRYYNDDPSFLRLERKEKRDGCGNKESCLLTRETYRALTEGDVSDYLYDSTQPLLQRFSMDILTRHFTPRLIVDYERVAYVEPTTNVRITMDYNISVSRQLDRFLTGDYLREPLMRKDLHVLEVKFDDILPAYIKQCLYESQLQQRSFSKYFLGFEKYRRMSS
ncbi:MAG: polyphosphate polymerase domain-containing protein [Oscillospiraceae bacterium]|nr:polyphosphate polymerase domain-containing protein [Oscillospiraceae bacterium]